MKTLLTIIFLAISATTFVKGQLLSYQNFNHRDGLNSATINCIIQSKDGYIWLGTDGSDLVRFDGNKFEEIDFKNGDDNHHFSSFSMDGENLLFSSRYKGFFSYSRKSNSLIKLDDEKTFIGESIKIYRKDSIYYFIGTNGINFRNGNVYGNLFNRLETKVGIKINHEIETDHSVFLFSNNGSFRINRGKLTPLSALINIKQQTLEKFNFGYIQNGKLILYSQDLNEMLTADIDEKDNLSNATIKEIQPPSGEHISIISLAFNKHLNSAVALTKSGEVFQVDKMHFKRIAHNYNTALPAAQSIIIDFNGDYWVTSANKGLFKISSELFTKVQFNPIFESPAIYTIFQTTENKFIFSKDQTKTYIGKLKNHSTFSELPFGTHNIVRFEDKYLLATSNGVILYDPVKDSYISKYFSGKVINLVSILGDFIFVGVSAEGLYKINKKTNKTEKIESPPGVNYYYTAQYNHNAKELLFGTNYGIMRLAPHSNKVFPIPIDYKKLGGYSGVSTKDKFGTCWFTLERGIFGLTSKNKIVEIYGEKYLNTNLFYTLSSDLKGNLIIGTNKGIILNKVDAKGTVLKTDFYGGVDGFLGYETNMRAQFQDGNLIYVGTVEGLFQINTDNLSSKLIPPPPIILKSAEENLAKALGDNSVSFVLKTNNTKTKSILYEYRLKDKSNDWTTTKEVNIILNNLASGRYTIEVRSTYDGVNFSEINTFQFDIKSQFWKSNWFLIALIISIIIINVIIVLFYRSREKSTLINTKDVDVHLQIAPAILLFATIGTPLAILFAPIADGTLEYHFGIAFSLGFALLTLYFLSLVARTTMKEHLFGYYLKIGLSLVLLCFFWEAYRSSLNPYFIFGILLTSTMAPYIFNRIILTVGLAIAIFLVALSISFILDVTVYPKFHFLTSIFFMGCLIIFSSYLRFDSLEKLIFISGIINKGNVPAIAFNKNGIVTYASENVNLFISLSHNELINNNISILNQYVPQGAEANPRDITKEFKDGEKYLVPMENSNGGIRWIEWSYKDFSKDLKVILGQDVSEKIELENTYELLVESAEDFIYRCDASGNYVFINNVSFLRLGYSKDELMGLNSISIVVDEYKDEVAQYYREHLQSQRHSSYKELPIQKKNGEILWIGQSLTTIFSVGSNKQVIGFIALARDITNIRAQQEIIREQRDSITSSINYARRIQYNLLPHENLFQSNFKEHFIFSKPKDIVSGDFYWMKQIEDHTVLVLADCTGHGVPGSFMTLLGFNLLNSIVLEGRTIDPSKIMNELDQKLVEYLPRGEGENTVHDGMEVTICVFNNKTNEMSYACAGSRFLAYENNAFTMFKGDNKHIGDIEPDFVGYNSFFKEFKSDYNLFLFTDGFQDQFGGVKDKKYSFRRLLELFEASINLPLAEQGRIVENEFQNWIGDNQQTDDVTILSVTREIINFDEHEDLP